MKRYALIAALLAFAVPSYAAEHKEPSAFGVHGSVGLYWREHWVEQGGTPKWLELKPVVGGEMYLGLREYAKGWTIGGELEFSVRRIDDDRSLRFGLRREF